MTSSQRHGAQLLASKGKKRNFQCLLVSYTLGTLPVSMTLKLKFYTLGGQLQQTHLHATDFFPRKKTLRLEKGVRPKPWCFSLIFFLNAIRSSDFQSDCAVLSKTSPTWIIYKASGNCKLWWTNLSDILTFWRAVLVSPSASLLQIFLALFTTASHLPHKSAQLLNIGKGWKERIQYRCSLST